MKICQQCQQTYPDHANYCITCGSALVTAPEKHGNNPAENGKGWNIFWLSLVGSLVLTWLLVAVFHLPIFIIGAFLPLLWFSRK